MYSANENSFIFKLLRSKVTCVIVIVAFSVAMIGTFAICNAKNITIFDGAVSRTVRTSSENTDKILSQAGFQPLEEGDLITVNNVSTVQSSLIIERAFDITLSYHGEETTVPTTKVTVEELLAKRNISLEENDVVTPELSSLIEGACTISIDSVTFTEETYEEEVKYSTEYCDTEDLLKGQSQVQTEGVNGLASNTYSVKTVNGVRTEVKLIAQTILTDPVNEVILKGTRKPEPGFELSENAVTTYCTCDYDIYSPVTPDYDFELDAYGRPTSYTRCITGKASAYYAKAGARTATGALAQPGYIAIDPKIIPYGTRMYIKTTDGSFIYGYSIAADTGGFTRWGTRVADLYFSTYSECCYWGIRNIEIYILD